MVFSKEIYKRRRVELIKSMPEHSALILPSQPQVKYSGDVDWPYRPSSDLIYLSGCEEPNSCLIILSNKPQEILFVQKKDPKTELWIGPSLGPEEAGDVFDMDSSYPVSEFSNIALELMKEVQAFYYNFGFNAYWDKEMDVLIQRLKQKNRVFISVHDSIRLTAPLRMKKNPEEIKTIQQAIDISVEAHIETMKYCKPGLSEGELHGRFLFETMKRGSNLEAYPGIFASGPSACTLHYTDNKQVLKEGELFLVDAGAEYHYYASDITRTYPVSGRFSKVQKRIYQKLLTVQKNMIQILKPGLLFSKIQSKLVELLAHLMQEEGFLSGSMEEIIEKKTYKKYFPHTFGHSLGLDVHDPVFSPEKDIKLESGFVLTMEPGIYLPSEDYSIGEDLRGVGIRIEDDILITKDGAKVLSAGAPKEVGELETLVGSET